MKLVFIVEMCDNMILESNGQFECSVCGRGFPLKKTCRRHVQNVHCDHQKVLCPVCQKYMKKQTTLKSHLRGSHGVYQKWTINITMYIIPDDRNKYVHRFVLIVYF